MNSPRKLIHKTFLGNRLYRLFEYFYFRVLPDSYIIKRKYKKVFGTKPNLDNPQTLNEKILWLKLNDRTSLHTICADKYAVRDYVGEKIGEKYLVPLYFQTTDPKQINKNNIHKTPCIIKTNHDSSGGIFIYDTNSVEWPYVREMLSKRMSKNYYWRSKEWQYKNIKPRIIIEKLLLDSNGNVPFDYKVHCFNGKAQMIQVDMERGSDRHSRNWYSIEWEREPYKWSSSKGAGKFTDPSNYDIESPKNLNQMISLSEKLAEPFIYVRVDWYAIDSELYFGELTFHHDGGYRPIEPPEWDLKLGQLLKIK